MVRTGRAPATRVMSSGSLVEDDLGDVRCPFRAIHGLADDLEPYANVERLIGIVDDIAVLALPGLGHLGPWLWPDLRFVMLNDA